MFVCVVLFGAVAPSSAWADMVLTYNAGATASFKEGKMAHRDASPLWTIIDSSAGVVSFVNDMQKQYATGTPADVCAAFNKIKTTMMAVVPPEQRELIFGNGKPANVTVKDGGPGDTVVGFATEKYEVLSNGGLYSQLYLSNDPKLIQAIGGDWKKMTTLGATFGGCMSMSGSDPHNTAEYRKLMEKGVVLKEKRNRAELTEVKGIDFATIPASRFAPPPGYSAISFDEMIGTMMGGK
jgi:hypothetical protein